MMDICFFVDCVVLFEFASHDIVRRFSLPIRKSKVKTPLRLANVQHVKLKLFTTYAPGETGFVYGLSQLRHLGNLQARAIP
jgi:hypothetical protein